MTQSLVSQEVEGMKLSKKILSRRRKKLHTRIRKSQATVEEKEAFFTEENYPISKSTKADDPQENKALEVVSESQKKRKFIRVFSDEDEVVILKGLIESKNRNKETRITPDFVEYFNHSQGLDVTKTQLYEKVRRLKSRYTNSLTKRATNKLDSHDQELNELSEKLWGDDQEAILIKSAEIERRVKDGYNYEKELEGIEEPYRSEMKKKWYEYKIEVLEMFLMQVSLWKEQADVLLELV